ncbi:hypothetical protein CDAR_197041 [Caerostris darwini]|uniref:Uncharacterized protein n=1 Tax=Caerostris darwini TaxID=1538125 RepID=A0AAV4SRI9_9ARAC|nr:hypothetical protein CDAR_197041 [Caerostris darwini]
MVSDMKRTRGDSWKRASRLGRQTNCQIFQSEIFKHWVGWTGVDGAAQRGGGSFACDGVASSGLTFL